MIMPQPLLSVYQQNAGNWLTTIDDKEIPSRVWTNPAIVSAARTLKPQSVLDVGCGEGWLLRALGETTQDYKPALVRVGCDGVSDFISAARQKDPDGKYVTASYDDLRSGTKLGQFELIIFNYSLFGKEEVVDLLRSMLHAVKPNGHLLIQTIHDSVFPDPGRWLLEDWQSMKGNYEGSYSWYYRSLGEWESDLEESGWSVVRCTETAKPDGQKLSYIFTVAPRTLVRGNSKTF